MWEIDNLSQLLGFLYAAVLGAFYCCVYDVLRALRAEIKLGTAAVFVTDILYSAFCALTCFCFMLSVTAGEIRGFVFAGAAVGFAASRLTLSRLLFFVFTKIVRAVRLVFIRVSLCFGRFFALTCSVFDFLRKKLQKICVFLRNTLKKHLKKQ